jgi:hypothetical protein
MHTQVLEHAAIIGQGLDAPCYVVDLGCDDPRVQVGGIELSGVAAGGGANVDFAQAGLELKVMFFV